MTPNWMRDSDMLRPIPRAPPVTIMTFPVRLKVPGTLLSWPAWTWSCSPGTWGVVAEDGVSGIDDSLVVICPVGVSVTSEIVAVGLVTSSV